MSGVLRMAGLMKFHAEVLTNIVVIIILLLLKIVFCLLILASLKKNICSSFLYLLFVSVVFYFSACL
jgi:hypothetical protein